MIVLTMVKFYHKSGILSTREHTMTTAAMCHLTQFLFTAVYCQFHNGTEGATTGRKKHFMSLPVVPPPIVLDKQEGESPATFFRHYISFSDCCSFIGAEFILGGGGRKQEWIARPHEEGVIMLWMTYNWGYRHGNNRKRNLEWWWEWRTGATNDITGIHT